MANSSGTGFKVTGTKALIKCFKQLNTREMRNTYRAIYREVSNKLVSKTRTELYHAVGRATARRVSRRWKKNKSMVQGIKKIVYRDGTGASVNILGEYRLKFAEYGTQERFTKKGQARGSAWSNQKHQTWFFKKANESFLPEAKRYIETSITKQINKRYEKKYGD